jgi:hypothetical protein
MFHLNTILNNTTQNGFNIGKSPQSMAALRNLAITLIHRSGFFQIAASRRHFAPHPREAFPFLLQRRFAQQ